MKWTKKGRTNPTIAWMMLCISISEKMWSVLWHPSFFFSCPLPTAHPASSSQLFVWVCHSYFFWVHYTRASCHFECTTDSVYSVFDESNEWMDLGENGIVSIKMIFPWLSCLPLFERVNFSMSFWPVSIIKFYSSFVSMCTTTYRNQKRKRFFQDVENKREKNEVSKRNMCGFNTKNKPKT